VEVADCQAFGRFGYERRVVVPAFTVDGAGFSLNGPDAESFQFEAPSQVWSCQAMSAYGETVNLSGIGRSPVKLKADLWAPGFAVYLQHGLALKVRSKLCPYLSWTEGSVGPDVPTPKCPWVLVSFQDRLPPVLLAFVSRPEALRLVGKEGDWTLETESRYEGWVRIVAPCGLTPQKATSAEELGKLVAVVGRDADRWTQPAPQLQSFSVQDGATSVTATWSFDKPGAVVPVAAVLAPLGGYPVEIESKTERLNAANECGPVTLCSDPKLVVKFPVRRLPTGRSLPIGEISPASAATEERGDPISATVESAFANLQAARPATARSEAEDALASYLTAANYVLEPFTGQRLPFAASGSGADEAAAYAVLMQALYSTVSATSEANALLTSLSWRRDAYLWTFWSEDPVVERRTGALAALAGALCPEPARRAEGAMFEAGVAARRGLWVWRSRLDPEVKAPALIEPVEAVRDAFFLSKRPGETEDAFAASLFSDIRVYGEQRVLLASLQAGGFRLAWSATAGQPDTLTLASAYPLEITARSVFDDFTVSQALGFTIVRFKPKSAGQSEAVLKIPSWALPLPSASGPPRYSETAR
jgi:hypothetical protein